MKKKEIKLINAIFNACAEFGKEGVHYHLEDGLKIWDDTLHSVIEIACLSIIGTFEDFGKE